MGWIGVDFDGTLARYEGWNGGELGEPIPHMVSRVKELLANGKTVKIFTARVGVQPGAVSLESGAEATEEFAAEQRAKIQAWCEKYIGVALEVTNIKDFDMDALWDDRAVSVVCNEGILLHEQTILLRIAQKHYYEMRTQHALGRAMEAERTIDRLLGIFAVRLAIATATPSRVQIPGD